MAHYDILPDGHVPMAGSHEAITVSTSAVTLTATKYITKTLTGYPTPTEQKVLAYSALITLDATNGIKFTVDGTTPTSSVGHAVAGGDSIRIVGFENIRKFQAIRSGASDATIRVTYFTHA